MKGRRAEIGDATAVACQLASDAVAANLVFEDHDDGCDVNGPRITPGDVEREV